MVRFAIVFAVLALAGCTSTGGVDTSAGQAQASRTPPDAKAVILANKGRLWKDPDSIRSTSITEPTPHMGFMWHVCVRLNAKNSFGGYTGEQENLIGIYDDGRPPAILIANAALNCERLPHEPFPELEAGRPQPPRAKR